MSEINWQEPPAGRRTKARAGKWQQFADALRARPGHWALMSEDIAVSVATQINKGTSAAFRPAGAFEATTRTADDSRRGRGAIWVRYVGSEATR